MFLSLCVELDISHVSAVVATIILQHQLIVNYFNFDQIIRRKKSLILFKTEEAYS